VDVGLYCEKKDGSVWTTVRIREDSFAVECLVSEVLETELESPRHDGFVSRVVCVTRCRELLPGGLDCGGGSGVTCEK